MKTLLMTALIIGSFSALAQPGGKGECFKHLKLSATQQSDIKAERKAARGDIIPLSPALALAEAKLAIVMLNASTTKDEAIAARKKVRKARKPIRKIRRKMRQTIQFDILTGEQRVKLYACRKVSRAGRRGPGSRN